MLTTLFETVSNTRVSKIFESIMQLFASKNVQKMKVWVGQKSR